MVSTICQSLERKWWKIDAEIWRYISSIGYDAFAQLKPCTLQTEGSIQAFKE